jgi:hypothetical protein
MFEHKRVAILASTSLGLVVRVPIAIVDVLSPERPLTPLPVLLQSSAPPPDALYADKVELVTHGTQHPHHWDGLVPGSPELIPVNSHPPRAVPAHYIPPHTVPIPDNLQVQPR